MALRDMEDVRPKANLVGMADFFKRPANAHVTRQSLTAIMRRFKSGDGWDF